MSDAVSPKAEPTWKRWGLHTPQTLRERAQQLNIYNYLVDGLIAPRSIGFGLGNSGLGKSPLWYQLGICLATGVPFLGRAVNKGRVVIADFENGVNDVLETVERISQYLGLQNPPNQGDLLIWTVNDCPTKFGQANHTLLDMLRDIRPALAIIDSFGSYKPEAEEKNSTAIRMLQEFRELAKDHGTATQGIHHRRKDSRKKEDSAGPLEGANLRRWFQEARGASALVNASDVRLGVDEPDLSAATKDDVALVVRGFARVRGEIGPLYLARDFDDEQRPLGYRCLVGPELLFNQDQQESFARLSEPFSFKQAKAAYQRKDQATNDFLQKCIRIGILRKPAKGLYEKVRTDGVSGVNG